MNVSLFYGKAKLVLRQKALYFKFWLIWTSFVSRFGKKPHDIFSDYIQTFLVNVIKAFENQIKPT